MQLRGKLPDLVHDSTLGFAYSFSQIISSAVSLRAKFANLLVQDVDLLVQDVDLLVIFGVFTPGCNLRVPRSEVIGLAVGDR